MITSSLDEEENNQPTEDLKPTLVDGSTGSFDSFFEQSEPVSAQLEPPAADQKTGSFDDFHKESFALDDLFKQEEEAYQAQSRERSGKAITDLEKFLEDNKFMRSAITAFSSDAYEIYKEGDSWKTPFLSSEKDDYILGSEFLTGGVNYVTELLGNKAGITQADPAILDENGDAKQNNLIDSFQKATGLSDEEVQSAWRDLGKIYKPMEEGEDYRVLSNGTFRPNLSSAVWLDDEKAIKTIESSGANKDEIKAYKERYKEFQNLALKQQLIGFTAMSNDKGSDDANFWKNESLVGKITDSPVSWATKNGRMQDFGTKEFMKDYREQVIDKLNLGDKLKIDLFLSEKKLEQQFTGLGGLLGSEGGQERSVQLTKETQEVNSTKPDTGWMGTLTQESIPLLSQVLLTRGASSLATSALTKKMGLSAASAAANKFVGMPAAVALSGMQSAGLTYSSALAEGDSEDVAREKGIKAGVSTGIITGIFQGLGAGGAEKLASGAPKRMQELLQMGKAGNLKQLTKEFAKDVLKDTLGEGLEEGLDEFVQTFLTADENESVADAWSNALEAAKAGMIIGGFAGGTTVALDKALEFTGLEKTREALREQAQVDPTMVTPSLAEAQSMGLKPSEISSVKPSEPTAAPATPVVLSSSVKADGVEIAPKNESGSFIEEVYGAPAENKEYVKDFDSGESFALEPVKGNPNLEVVTHNDGDVTVTTDRVYNHTTGQFEAMPDDLKAYYTKRDGYSPKPKGAFEVKKQVEPKSEVEQAPQDTFESDTALASEKTEDIINRTPAGPDREAAVQKRNEAAVRMAKTIKKGDVVITADGERLVAETDANPKNGEVLFEGFGTPVKASTYFLPDRATVNGVATELEPAKIERTKTSQSSSESSVLGASAATTPTGAIESSKSLTPEPTTQTNETKTKIQSLEKADVPASRLEKEITVPQNEKGQEVLVTPNEQLDVPAPDEKTPAAKQEAVENKPATQEKPTRPFEPVFTSKESQTTSEQTQPEENFAGVRYHNEETLNKIVKKDSVKTKEKGKDSNKTTTYYVDSHETETEDGGENKDVTIGSMRVGSFVAGRQSNGQAGSLYRVVQTTVLKNGAIRHHLKPVMLKGDTRLDNDPILAAAFRYAPNEQIFVAAKALGDLVRDFDLSKGKLTEDPAALQAVKDLIMDHFGTLVNSTFASDVVVFEDSDELMYVTQDENGKTIIKVSPRAWLSRLSAGLGYLAPTNMVARTQLSYDFSENIAFTALEELVHYQAAQEFAFGTEGGDELVGATKEVLNVAKTAPLARAEIIRSAKWRNTDFRTMTDDEIMAALEVADDVEIWAIGQEMLASLYSRIKTGKDPQSVRAAANSYLKMMVGDDSSQRASLTKRLFALVERYMNAIRDFFKAHESLEQLPPSFAQILRNVESMMENKGFDETGAKITLPDPIGIKRAAIEQAEDVMDHVSVFAKDGLAYSQVQKALRAELSVMRDQRKQEDFMPISMNEDGGLFVSDQATESERIILEPIVAELNTNKRPEVALRSKLAAKDLARVLTWMNKAPLLKTKIKQAKNGDLFRDIENNTMGILLETGKAIQKAVGEDLGEFFFKLRNSATQNGTESQFDKSAFYDFFTKDGEPGTSSAASKAVSAYRDAEAAYEKDESLRDAYLEAGEEMMEALRDTSEIYNKTKELADANRELSDLIASGKFDATMRQAAEGKVAQEQSKAGRTPVAEEIFNMLQAMLVDKGRLESNLSPFQMELGNVRNVKDLINLASANPSMARDIIMQASQDKGESVLLALDEALKIATSIERLKSFNDELTYMLLGGRKPESSFASSEARANTQSFTGRVADFNLTLVAFPTLNGDRIVLNDGDEAINFEGWGPIKGTNFSIAPTNASKFNEARMRAAQIGSEVSIASENAAKLFGVESNSDEVYDRNGNKLSKDAIKEIMQLRATEITKGLVADMYDAQLHGDQSVTAALIDTMGFSFPYKVEKKGEDNEYRHFSKPSYDIIDLPTEFGFGSDFTESFLGLLKSGSFSKTIEAVGQFVINHTQPALDRSRSLPTLHHNGGLTPAGLAHQAVAPKLLEFLALTKGLEIKTDKGSVSIEQYLSPEAKSIYNLLFSGVESAPALALDRNRAQSGTYLVNRKFFELHRAGKVANSIYAKAMRLNPESYEMSPLVSGIKESIPLDFDQLSMSSFALSQAQRISQQSKLNQETFITNVKPIRASRALDIFNSLNYENSELVNNVDPELVESNKFKLQAIENRKNRWRTEMLLALLDGDQDAVVSFIHQPQFAKPGINENGEPAIVYDTDAIDKTIADQLEALQKEELTIGSVIDSNNRNYTAGVRQLFEEYKLNEDIKNALELVLDRPSMVQVNAISDPIQLEPAAFDADAKTLVEYLMLQIPNLTLIEGSASWENSKIAAPDMVFVPSSSAPTIVMPFGSKQAVSPEDLRKVMSDVLLWSSQNGNGNVMGAANQVLAALRSFRDSRSPLVHHMANSLSENGEIGATEIAIANAFGRLIEKQIKEAINQSVNDKVGNIIPHFILNEVIEGKEVSVLTNEHAAAIVVAALTSPALQRALMLSITREPGGSDPTSDKIALRGNLIAPSVMPGFIESYRNALVTEGSISPRMAPELTEDGFEEVSAIIAQRNAEEAENSLRDADGNEIPAYYNPAGFDQSEWASKLLHNVLDQAIPKFGMEDVEEGPFRGDKPAFKPAKAPKGLVGAPKPEKLTLFEARQILGAIDPVKLSQMLESEKITLPSDLMELSGVKASFIRDKYKTIKTIENLRDYTEDNLFNYGNFSYDTSLWSDNSRKDVYEKARVKKGMIAAGLADGAKKFMDEFGTEKLSIEANLDAIEQLRASQGRSRQVFLVDGKEVSSEEFAQSDSDNKETISDLEWDRRQYNEEVKIVQDAIETERKIALSKAAEIDSYELALAEIGQIEEQLKDGLTYKEFEQLLKGSKYLPVNQLFKNTPDFVKLIYSEPENLIYQMTQTILQDYNFGASSIDGRLSLYVNREYENAEPTPTNARVSQELSSRLDDLNDKELLVRRNTKFSEKRRSNELEAIKRQRKELQDSQARYEQFYNRGLEVLKAQIDKVNERVAATENNLKLQIQQIQKDFTDAKANADISVTEDGSELFFPGEDQIQKQIGDLQQQIYKARRDAAAEIKQLSKNFDLLDLGSIQESLRARGLETFSNSFVELTKEAETRSYSQTIRDARRRKSTLEHLMEDYANLAYTNLRKDGSNTLLSQLAEELEESPEIATYDYLGFENEQQAESEASLQREILRARFDREAAYHNQIVSGLVKAVNKEFSGLLRLDDFKVVSRYGAAAAQAKTNQLITALRDTDTLREMLKIQSAKNAISQVQDFDFGKLLGSSRDLSLFPNDVKIQIPKEAMAEIQSVLTKETNDALKKDAIAKALAKHVFPYENVARSFLTTMRNLMQEEVDAANMSPAAFLTEVTKIANTTEGINNLPSLIKEKIVLSVAKDALAAKASDAQVDLRTSLRNKVAHEMSYARRRNRVYAPRSNGQSVMNYEGTPDDIEILSRNHAKRGITWSQNYMRNKTSSFDAGFAGALDRAEQADILEMTASELSTIEGRKFIVKDGQVQLETPSIPILRTSSAPMTEEQKNAQAEATANAAIKYKNVIKSGILGKADESIEEESNRLSVSNYQKDDLYTRMVDLEKAIASGLYAEAGRTIIVDSENNIVLGESLQTRMETAMNNIKANPTFAQLTEITNLHNALTAYRYANESKELISKGYVRREATAGDREKALFKGSMFNHDSSVRWYFAKSLRAQEAVEKSIGLLDSGSTGLMGRHAYEVWKHSTAERFNKQIKKLKGKERYENAARGVMFAQVMSYLGATNQSAPERAKALLSMFDQAEDGYRKALANKIPRSMDGMSAKAILNGIKKKGVEVFQFATEDTFRLLEDRVLFDQMKAFWTPWLEQVADPNVQMNIGDMKFEVSKLLGPQAVAWSDFITKEMKYAKESLATQAALNGMDYERIMNQPDVPFRWKVFSRESSLLGTRPDAKELLAVDRAMFMQSPNRKPKVGEIHMLDINGLTAPLEVINDALYRIAMTPAYGVFDQLAGSVESTGQLGDGTFEQVREGFLYKTNTEFSNPNDSTMVKEASVIIANLGTDIIKKDMFSSTEASRLMDGVQKVSQLGAIGALLSAKQIWAQTMFGVFTYANVRGGLRENRGFTRTYMRVVKSLTTDKLTNKILNPELTPDEELGHRVVQFAMKHAPFVHARRADGNEDVLAKAELIKKGTKSRAAGRILGRFSKAARPITDTASKVANLTTTGASKLLHGVMATPESVVSQAIFAFEVLKQVNKERVLNGEAPISFDDLVNPNFNRILDITSAMKSRAETVVNDIMAPTDRSKKSKLFTSAKTVPIEMIRGMFSTFANHMFHLAGNSTAAISMIKRGDSETKKEGLRLLGSNLTQNILYRLVNVPTIVWALSELLFDDEDEKDKFVRTVFGAKEGESRLTQWQAWATTILGGAPMPMGYKRSDGSIARDDTKMKQAQANLAQQVGNELVMQLVPYLGIAASTSFGSKFLDAATEKLIYGTIMGEEKNYDRAGFVTFWGGENTGGAKAEHWWQRLAYGIGWAWTNWASRLSAFANGLNYGIDPIIRMSNTTEQLSPMDAFLFYASEIPIIPREVSGLIQKEVDEKYGAKIYDSSWNKERKQRSLDF